MTHPQSEGMTSYVRLEPCNCGLHTRFCIYVENGTVTWTEFTGTDQLETLAQDIMKRILVVKPFERAWLNEATAEGLQYLTPDRDI